MVGMWLTSVSTTFFFVVPKECHKREADCATADTNKRCSWLRAPDLENGSKEQTILWDACSKHVRKVEHSSVVSSVRDRTLRPGGSSRRTRRCVVSCALCESF